jgi:molybdopterin converting factor small subunit
MSVTIKLSTLFHKYTEGQQFVRVRGGSPLQCLRELKTRFPKIARWLYDKQGNLRPQIWLFVNGQKISVDDLNKPLNDGDELFVVLAISGG